jgi:hypothetical protein
MRHNPNARTMKVDKAQLIAKIKDNKAKHIEEYKQAVEDYKAEAEKQLKAQSEALAKGSLEIRIQLVTPVNQEAEYDKLVTMFEWDVDNQVELSQGEFNEYVLDETAFAVQAKMLNSTYSRNK